MILTLQFLLMKYYEAEKCLLAQSFIMRNVSLMTSLAKSLIEEVNKLLH